jgi:putative endonuclease
VGRKFESYLGSIKVEMMKVVSFFFAAMYYVYILFSTSSDRYYIGHTPDVQKRLEEHNNPQRSDKYTAKHLPWMLILFFKISTDRGEAMIVERFIKNQKSRLFIEKLIAQKDNLEYFETLTNNILKKVG